MLFIFIKPKTVTKLSIYIAIGRGKKNEKKHTSFKAKNGKTFVANVEFGSSVDKFVFFVSVLSIGFDTGGYLKNVI